MEKLAIILGMFAVTYFSRALPMLREFELRGNFIKYIPPSIFSSLVFSDVFAGFSISEKTLAGAVVFLVALRNRNLLLAMVVGVLSLYLLQKAEIF